MKKGTVNFLWILVVILIILISVSSNIKDINAKGEKNIGQRAIACMVAAILACLCVWYIAKDEGKKEAKKKYLGESIVGFPKQGKFDVLNQGIDDGNWRFLRLRNTLSGEIYSYIDDAKLVDQGGQEITTSVPSRIEIQKHVEVEIDKEKKHAKNNPVYYVFPLEGE